MPGVSGMCVVSTVIYLNVVLIMRGMGGMIVVCGRCVVPFVYFTAAIVGAVRRVVGSAFIRGMMVRMTLMGMFVFILMG